MISLRPGRYIVAVSGGVDSMVLLDMLRQDPHLNLIVAHVDHGMRPDSAADATFVQQYCNLHDVPFMSTRLTLGKHASEDDARIARYNFLQQCCEQQHADAIITAHHQDDVLETVLLAYMRGTGWRGLAPFMQNQRVIRPLLDVKKWQLVGYARKHGLAWREDSTNTNERYTRNYIRHSLIPLLDQRSDTWRDDFLQYIRKQHDMRRTITKLLDGLCKTADIHRYQLIMAPRTVAYEMLQQRFRMVTGNSLERPLAEAALLFVKTAKPHKVMELSAQWRLRAEPQRIIVEARTP